MVFVTGIFFLAVLYEITTQIWLKLRFLIENLFFGTRVVYLQSHFPREKNLVRHNTVVVAFFILPSLYICLHNIFGF